MGTCCDEFLRDFVSSGAYTQLGECSANLIRLVSSMASQKISVNSAKVLTSESVAFRIRPNVQFPADFPLACRVLMVILRREPS